MLQTAGEEGSEEVKQGIVSALTQKAAYDTKKPWYATDGDAVVNPSRMVQEYAGGALLGGVVSGAHANGRAAPAKADVAANPVDPRTGLLAPKAETGAARYDFADSGTQGIKTPYQPSIMDDGRVLADLQRFDSNIVGDRPTARTAYIKYARENFPETVFNRNTGAEIRLSRDGYDKLLSGGFDEKKYASAFHVPELVESAVKEGSAPNSKLNPKPEVRGYDYYKNTIGIPEIDAGGYGVMNPYDVYIRVRKTPMGDKYYGHTLGEVVDIEIEPPKRGSSGINPSVHSVQFSGSNSDTSIPRISQDIKPQNHEVLPVGLAEMRDAAARIDKGAWLPYNGAKGVDLNDADTERAPGTLAALHRGTGTEIPGGGDQAGGAPTYEGFLAEAQRSGKETGQAGKVTWSYTRTPDADITDSARRASAILRDRYGIESTVHNNDFSVFDGVSTRQTPMEAQTAPSGAIFIANNTKMPAEEIAGHEKIHYIAKTSPKSIEDFYQNAIFGNMNLDNSDLNDAVETIGRAYLGENFDITDLKDAKKIFEELSAYISGWRDVDAGTTQSRYVTWFQDNAAVEGGYRQLDEMLEQRRNGGSGSNPPSVGAADLGFDPYSHMQNEYGTIKPGEAPRARELDVPTSTNGDDRVSLYARTLMEASATPGELLADYERNVANGLFSHNPRKDASSLSRAVHSITDKGYAGALAQWDDVVQGRRTAVKDDIVLAQMLYAEAAKAGDMQTAMKLAAEIAAEGTRAGQNVQAFRMLKKLTPEGQLYYAQRTRRLRSSGTARITSSCATSSRRGTM